MNKQLLKAALIGVAWAGLMGLGGCEYHDDGKGRDDRHGHDDVRINVGHDDHGGDHHDDGDHH